MNRFLAVISSAALLAVACQSSVPAEEQDAAIRAVRLHNDESAMVRTTAWTELDEHLMAPIWRGNEDKGFLLTPLFRGAIPGVEDYVYAPPDGDCTKAKSTIRIDWDKGANTVTVLTKGKNLPVNPTLVREEGKDFWSNEFHHPPKDITQGTYRLWIVLGSTTRLANLYYNEQDLKLVGSEFDFPAGPPAGTLAVKFPVFSITGTSQMVPDADGTLVHEFTVPYDRVTVEDGRYSRAWLTFVPHNLCQGAPLQPGISQLRPYVTRWLPPEDAPTWNEMLKAGVAFDLQIEQDTPTHPVHGDNLPYVYSAISYLSNAPALQGGIPNGWQSPILTHIQNVSPVIRPVPGGNGLNCKPYVSEPHVNAPRYCELSR